MTPLSFMNAYEGIAHAARISAVEAVHYTDAISEIRHQCNLFRAAFQPACIEGAIASVACGRRSLAFCSSVKPGIERRAPFVAVSGAIPSEGLVFVPESVQEAVDMTILAYRICEDRNVMLPATISIDMPGLSESVALPSDKSIASFLPRIRLPYKLGDLVECKPEQVQLAMANALKLLGKISEEWKKKFRRSCSAAEEFMLADAEYAFVVSGMQSGTAKAAVSAMRQQGEKAGLLRLCVLPHERAAMKALAGKKIAVVGSGTLLYDHMQPAHSFVAQRLLSEKDFAGMLAVMKREQPRTWWL